jgi:hypothetical protein
VFYNGPWSLFCLCWKVLQTVVFEYLSTPCVSAKHCSNIPESTRYQRHNLWTISIITLKLDQRWYLMTLPNHLGISISVKYIDPEIRRWNCAVKAKSEPTGHFRYHFRWSEPGWSQVTDLRTSFLSLNYLSTS